MFYGLAGKPLALGLLVKLQMEDMDGGGVASFLVMLFARIPITSYHVFLLKYCSCLLFYDQISSPPLYFSFAVASFETASEIAFLKRFVGSKR